jgi:hypothetical protein
MCIPSQQLLNKHIVNLLELCAFTLGPFVVNRKELKFIYFDVDYPKGIMTSLHYGLLGVCFPLVAASYDPQQSYQGLLVIIGTQEINFSLFIIKLSNFCTNKHFFCICYNKR